MADLSVVKFTLSKPDPEQGVKSIYLYCPTTNPNSIQKLLEKKINEGITIEMSEGMEFTPSYFGESSSNYYMMRVVINFYDSGSPETIYGWMFSTESVEYSEIVENFVQSYFIFNTSVDCLKYSITND